MTGSRPAVLSGGMDKRHQPSTTSTGPGVVLLGQVVAQLPTIDVACNRCDRCGRLQTARLVEEHGADMPVRLLACPLLLCSSHALPATQPDWAHGLGGCLGERTANMDDSHFSFVLDRTTEVGDRVNRV